MTKFAFEIGNENTTLETGLLPNPEVKTLRVRKTNSLEPLEITKTTNYTAASTVAIVSVNQMNLVKFGTGGASFQLNVEMKDYANRHQIISIFIDLVALASALGQKKNVETLKSALIDLLDVHLTDHELYKEFKGVAGACFISAEDGVPAQGGEISVQWNINLKKVITSDELLKLNEVLREGIKKGEKLKYSKQ